MLFRVRRPRLLTVVGTVAVLVAVTLAAPTSPASATPPPDTPSAPTHVTASAGDGSATLRWTAPSTSPTPITGYYVTVQGTAQNIRIPATTSYTVGNLTNGTPYRFVVAAINAAGRGAFSRRTAEVTPLAATVPDAPAQVTAVAGYYSATVSWTAPASGRSPITGYTVTSDPDGQTVTTTGEATSATVYNLTNGTPYTFTVTATNQLGDSSPSAASDPVNPDESVPTAPASITAVSGGNGTVDVSWDVPGSDGGEQITGYTVTSDPDGIVQTTDGFTTGVTMTGLRATAYTFSVVATNSLGDGPAAVSRPTRPAVRVASGAVTLSGQTLDSLLDIDDDNTLRFQGTPDQIAALQPGDVIVAGVSYATPMGLLRTVSAVRTVGSYTYVDTTDAALDQALSEGGLSLDGTLANDAVNTFQPARRGVTLAPATVGGPPSLKVSIDFDLYNDHHGQRVHVEGSEEITPHVSFSASVHCCFHVDSHFKASVEAQSQLKLTADLTKELGSEDGLELASINFTPIEFTVGPVPVVIVPTLDLSLQADGSVSVGITTSVTHTDEFGVDITTKDGHVDAQPINEHSTTFLPPTVFAAAEFRVGPRARLTMYLYGVAGPYVHDTLYLLDFSADTSEDPWWKLEINDTIGAGFHISLLGHELANWEAPTLFEKTYPIVDAGGPFMGVDITPNPATVAPSQRILLHAHVERSYVQKVTWSVAPGDGTINANGSYKAPATPGIYQVTATSPANGFKPETKGVIGVVVGAQSPDAPTAVTATSDRYGQATVSWTAPADGGSAITGYELQTAPYTTLTDTTGTGTSTTVTGLTPRTKYTFQVRAINDVDTSRWSASSAPVRISDYIPVGLGVLVVGSGDFGDPSGAQWLDQTLTAAGYVVVPHYSNDLPEIIDPFAQIWLYSTSGLSSADADRLAGYAENGGGVYLTGERPCCESVNATDMQVVDQLTPSAVQIGGLGDPFYAHGAVAVNPDVTGGVASTPNTLSTWTVDAPGGMSGVDPANTFASASGTPIGAVWGSDDLTGDGRVAVLMDINWMQPGLLDPATAPQIAQNLAYFLSGLSTPPSPRPVAVSSLTPAARTRPSRTAGRG